MIDRVFECQLYVERMKQVYPTLLEILEERAEVENFVSSLLDEVVNPETKISYKGHVFRAAK